MNHSYLYLLIIILGSFASCNFQTKTSENLSETQKVEMSGNPIFEGWYADPEGIVLNNQYWVFPTYSDDFLKQLHFDAFSSSDLVHWRKHENIVDTSIIKWAKQAMWAPSAVEKEGQYFFFFAANDVQRPSRPGWDPNNDINHFGGIGVAVANDPAGPYKDYLGKPLIDDFHNDAQPIDQFVYKDSDGTYYMLYGGWGHCNIGVLNDDFTGFVPWVNGSLFKEITPEGYVEGPFVFKRKGMYYFMWSEGGWTNDTYKVAYAMADNITGPYNRIGTILEADPAVATGAGHNSAINIPGSDSWFIIYHRRPIPNEDRDHRVTCIDQLNFNDDGTIKQVKMTFDGVESHPLD